MSTLTRRRPAILPRRQHLRRRRRSFRTYRRRGGLLFAARVRERFELDRDLILVLETVRTLHQVGDVLLKEILWPRADEAPRRLIRHAAHADADLHAARYVTRVHQRAQRARQRALHRALWWSTRTRARQTEIQRGVAVVARAGAAVVAAADDTRVAAVVVVIVVLASLHRRLQVRRQTGGQARRQVRRHHVVLLRVRCRNHATHLMSQTW